MNDVRDPEPPIHGKQLVFVFMAATVAAVVVFLAGVMVGRGVRLQRGGVMAGETLADPTLDPAPPLAAPTGSSSTGPSPASREGLSYPTQLSELNPPDVMAEPAEDPTAEALGRATPKSAKSAPAAEKTEKTEPAKLEKLEKPVDKPAPVKAEKRDSAKEATGKDAGAKPGTAEKPARAEKPAEPSVPVTTPGAAGKAPGTAVAADAEAGKGYAVQVAAVRDRGEADRIAARLKAKGYETYVTSPAPGMFRVRVGKFPDLEKANATAARLEKEEQFKPWITK